MKNAKIIKFYILLLFVIFTIPQHCHAEETTLTGYFESGTKYVPATFWTEEKSYAFDDDSIGTNWISLCDIFIDKCKEGNICKIVVDLLNDSKDEYDGIIKSVYSINGKNVAHKTTIDTANINKVKLIGPKIFGLQIGMICSDAEKMIIDLCKRKNYKYKVFDDPNNLNTNIKYFGRYKEPSRFPYQPYATCNNGIITEYVIPIEYINKNPDSINLNQFLKDFIANYSIPEISQELINGVKAWVYSDEKAGYSINIFYNLLDKCIYVKKIKKDSFNFE